MKRYERTRVLVEGDSALAHAIVKDIEAELGAPVMLEEPHEELVMIQVRETAHNSLFYLGEALMTSCRVRIGGEVGLGLILGSERCLAYELAVIDAAFSGDTGQARLKNWEPRLLEELEHIKNQELCEARHTAATRVDFATMEVEA